MVSSASLPSPLKKKGNNNIIYLPCPTPPPKKNKVINNLNQKYKEAILIIIHFIKNMKRNLKMSANILFYIYIYADRAVSNGYIKHFNNGSFGVTAKGEQFYKYHSHLVPLLPFF